MTTRGYPLVQAILAVNYYASSVRGLTVLVELSALSNKAQSSLKYISVNILYFKWFKLIRHIPLI